MKKWLLLPVVFFSVWGSANAQREKWGTWTSFGVEKKLDKWNFGAETELRTIYAVRLIDRWSISLDADYALIKPLKVGVGYQLMNTLDTKYLNYQLRNRFSGWVTGKQKWGKWSVSLRERLQVTVKDDSKRIDDNGGIDTYKINPAWVWRNKLNLSYNIRKNPITPGFSVETFYELNNPDGNQFNNFRYTLYADYKLNKHNVLEVYGLINQKTDEDEDYGKYIIGLSFTHSF